MDYRVKVASSKPLAQVLQQLPERVQERIAYIVEGALLAQECAEQTEPTPKAG